MSGPLALRHGRVSLTLHELRGGTGTKLLCLHALGASAEAWREPSRAWPGPVFALDFSGHGASGRVRGGSYTPELLAGDADSALAQLGEAALAGAGLGAYVALLLAGTRREHVPAALLVPGEGLAGGGAMPSPGGASRALQFPPQLDRPFAADPFAAMLDFDLRTTDYARAFADGARRLLLADVGPEAPPWWTAAGEAASAKRIAATDPAEGLRALAKA